MSFESINLAVAFLAGLISFFAPCFVALVPAFLSHLSGTSVSEIQDKKVSFSWLAFHPQTELSR